MSELSCVKVGDRITCFLHGMGGAPLLPEIRTVTRVLKTQVVDEKGQRWLISDGEYTPSSGWFNNNAELYRPEHDAIIAATRELQRIDGMVARLNRFRWADLSPEQLARVVAITKETR